jgi:hypothetical protein
MSNIEEEYRTIDVAIHYLTQNPRAEINCRDTIYKCIKNILQEQEERFNQYQKNMEKYIASIQSQVMPQMIPIENEIV